MSDQKEKKRVVKDWFVKDLISAIESGELDLTTEYQRDTIWPTDKQGLLIDSIFRDYDIPKIYFAHFPVEKKYECIDGKQRIYSILDFYNEKIKSTSGQFYSKIAETEKKVFLDYPLSVVSIKNPSGEEISELFYRLNYGIPLNGAERLHAMRGDMRDFVFDTIGKNGSFLKNLGIKAGKKYRFSRETALAQMVINSIYFRESDDKFVRARYEDLFTFFKKYAKFDSDTKNKTTKIVENLKEMESVFGDNASKLNRKSAIVSAYLFCEELIRNKDKKSLKLFPNFYLLLIDEMKKQATLVKTYKTPDKKILLDKFQNNLQQASAEGYSIERRHEFLKKTAFPYFLKTGKIVDDEAGKKEAGKKAL
jgi:hypothetical protein